MPDNTTAPALGLPQVAHTACPTCGAQPGHLCTSRGGTRVRRYDAHRPRTDAYNAETEQEGDQ